MEGEFSMKKVRDNLMSKHEQKFYVISVIITLASLVSLSLHLEILAHLIALVFGIGTVGFMVLASVYDKNNKSKIK